MAVAVKNKSETKTSPALRQLPVSIALGVLYVVASLVIVFPLLDVVWWTWLGFDRALGWWWVGRIAVSVVAAAVLISLGRRLLGPEPARGLIGGIFVGVVGFFLAVLLTQWLGSALESWVYGVTWLGSWSRPAGLIATAAVGGGLLVLLYWMLSRRGFERGLGALEDQGWFSTRGYKPNQGQKVRRGTILGLLIIIGTGVYALSGSLSAAGDWTLDVPFTGKVILTPQNVLTARTPQAGEDFPLRTQVLEHEQKVAAWRDARARALADIEKVLEQPNAKQQLQAELAELSVLDPVARQMINREETSSVIGEADPEAIIKSFKDRFGEIKTALKTPPPPPLTLDRFEVRDLNRQFAETYSRVVTPGEDVGGPIEVPTPDGIKVLPPTPDLEAGQLLPTAKVKEIIELRKARKEASELLITPPTVEDHPVLVTDKVTEGLQTANLLRYLNLTFLPSLKYTAPLLLGLLGVWFAWRLVNMPAFGDFLIATEAELNKVSWTTQKRLLQDTVVVLVTVVLLTVFLFFADAGWGMVLKLIGVVQPPTATAKTEKQSW